MARISSFVAAGHGVVSGNAFTTGTAPLSRHRGKLKIAGSVSTGFSRSVYVPVTGARYTRYRSGSRACNTFRKPASGDGAIHSAASRPLAGDWDGESMPAPISTIW